jgi:hypothetical protein
MDKEKDDDDKEMENEDNNNTSVTDSGNDTRTMMRTKTRMMVTRAVMNYQEREKGELEAACMLVKRNITKVTGCGRARYY